MLSTTFLFLMICSLGFLLYGDYTKIASITEIFKTLTSLLFIITAFTAYKESRFKNKKYFIFIMLGLFFCFLGDVLLASNSNSGARFVFGVLWFLFGHLSFLVGFFTYDRFTKRNLVFSIILAIFCGFLFFSTDRFDFKGLLPALIVYSIVISTMVGKSTSFWDYRKEYPCGAYMTLAGTFFFFVSDVILFIGLFSKTDAYYCIVLNNFIYYIGQGFMAMSLKYIIPKNITLKS